MGTRGDRKGAGGNTKGAGTAQVGDRGDVTARSNNPLREGGRRGGREAVEVKPGGQRKKVRR